MNRLSPHLILHCIVLAAVLAGCGTSSTGTGGGRNSISVTVKDDAENPLSGFTVASSSTENTATTDSTGNALLERVPGGVSEITVTKAGYPPFSQSITVENGKPQALTFVYIPHATVTVKDEKNRPIIGATISTLPVTYNLVTDGSGAVVFENLPLTSLKFIVRRPSLEDAAFTLETKRELQIVVGSAAPVVEILLPRLDDAYTSTWNISFSGRGRDFEDGELPDSALVWISNKDGMLGSGKQLTVPMLSPGYQTVTLRGTDSDGKQGENTVSFSVFDYQLDSYFPIPPGETWTYRYLVPEFYLTNSENVSEYWVLKNLSVKMSTDSRRVVDIYWDTVSQTITTHFRLTLSDSLQMDNGTVYISQTTEQSREWSGSEEKPYFIVYIGTSYNPRYTFLKNINDITAEPFYQSTVRAETEYSYTYYSVMSPVFHDSKAVTTSVRVGGEETIQTDRGLMKGTFVTIKQGESEKKWYLTRGIGLIRLEDTALNISTVAVLSNTSLLRFLNPSTKPVPFRASASPGSPPRFDLRIDRGKPSDIMRLHRFLAGMIPR
jgi:hypothetical protein